jgi:hypothetical protein
MSMKNLATLPQGAKQSTSPKQEPVAEVKADEAMKKKMNPASEQGEDENKPSS